MPRRFTQKHYRAIAEVIADQGFAGNNMDDRGRAASMASYAVMEGLVDRFVTMLAEDEDSDKFDEKRFRETCGGYEPGPYM